MSYESGVILAAKSEGYAVPGGEAEWQGSFDATWDKYVASHHRKPKSVNSTSGGRYFVYLIEVKIHGHVYHKVGITQDMNKRYKNLVSGFPVAEWSLARIVCVNSKYRAKKCETDLIVACSDLIVSGEWMNLSGTGA